MARSARYELLSRIARGGMAEIHVARTRAGGRDAICVVKKLLPEHAGKDEFVEMFLDEGRLVSALDHPNVVRVHEVGTEGGEPYLAMEYLHGEDLRTVLRASRARGKLVPREHALAIVAATCAGLHHAHEARGPDGAPLDVVHRDVSPHNVFLTFDGQVKVVDFGIAQATGRQTETRHGTLKGKVPYMAPEQVRARPLDRRTDVYAVGVVLYELLLGRRPYALASGGEFALMMAIARHDVRPPTSLDPAFPPRLEEIVRRALAYEMDDRHATARDLELDLRAYARDEGLVSSPAAIASWLADLFGDRVDAWRDAQDGRRELATHVVEVELARAESAVLEDEALDGDSTEIADSPSSAPEGGAPSVAARVASTSGAVTSVVELLGVTVITLGGCIDETFEGASLGRSLSGTVLLDLAAVQRITSFGVREWLAMTEAIAEAGTVDAFLGRCPEPIVNQLSLIRGFAGTARVASFQVAFLCDACGATFHGALDCQRDAALLASGATPTATCPRCAADARHDDDPGALAFAAAHLGVAVPEAVRSLLTSLESDRRPAAAVEKQVTPRETRIRIHRAPAPSYRWGRVLDGVEGQLVVDLRGATRWSPESAQAFAAGLRAVAADVTSCLLLDAPEGLVRALGPAAAVAPFVVSAVVFEARCPSCAAQRSGKVALDVMLGARPLVVPCDRCAAPLDVVDRAPRRPSAAPAPIQAPAPPSLARPARGRAVLPAVVAGLAVAGLAIAVIRGGETASSAAASVAAPSASGPVTRVEPAAAPDGVVVADDRVEVTVTARGRSEDDALAAARELASMALLEAMFTALPEEVRRAQGAPGHPPDAGAAIPRFEREVGAFAGPERVAARARRDGGDVTMVVTYRVAADAWTRAVRHFAATRPLLGLTLGRVFPTRGEGVVVVAAPVAAGVAPGAILATVDGRPIARLEELVRVTPGPHAVTFIAGHARIEAQLVAR